MIFNKKSTFKKAVAVTMAAILLSGSPIQTLAADKQQTKYVKEIRMFEKKEDIKGEYTPVKNRDKEVADFNQGTGKNAVYLGYTTTTNADEAIRDIAVMDMKGAYSFAEYEKVLESKKKDVKSYMADLQSAIKTFRNNFKKDDPLAMEGYKILNRYKDGDPDDPYAGEGKVKDTGKLLGDLLLSQDLSDDKLIRIFMESYSGLSCNLMAAIGIGIINDGKCNFMEKFSRNLGSYYRDIDAETEDKARQLVDLANQISKNVQQYEDKEWDIDENAEKMK